MKPLHLVLGAHNSRILNLADVEQERQYEDTFKPLLKLLYNRRDMKITLYYSGVMMEWLEKHHSEYVDVLVEMVKRRQVELLGGAFYEPVLGFVPKTDRLGQIERMTTHIRQRFGRRPRGAWMPENMWDPRVAASFNAGGLEYLLLQDSAAPFLQDREIPGPLVTEDQGKILVVVPVSMHFCSAMFTTPPARVLTELRELRERFSPEADVTVTIFFDGTFGNLPAERAEHAVTWLQEFLDMLSAQGGWVETLHPGRAVQRYRREGRRYAAVSSYAALMDWAGAGTFAGSDEEHSRCSFRSVMESYPESSRLYARMHHTHVLVNQIRGDKYRKQNAREELWQGQMHYPYWPNRAGGVYNAGLRKAAYAALIEAEKATRERGIFISAISRVDVDLDGREEILFQGNEINAYMHRRGAHLFELDYLPRNWNYLDTFQRRREPFHDDATRSAGYDTWPRAAFVDHLMTSDQTMEDFVRGDRNQICDISSLEYEIRSMDKDHHTVVFVGVCSIPESLVQLAIHKTYRFQKGRIDVEYHLANTGMGPLDGMFAVELNMSFHSLDVSSLRLNARQGRQRTELTPDRTELDGVSDLQFLDLHNNVTIQVSPSERPLLWSFPVEAVGMLGQGLHWFYQSNCTVFRWPLQLEPAGESSFTISVKLDKSR